MTISRTQVQVRCFAKLLSSAKSHGETILYDRLDEQGTLRVDIRLESGKEVQKMISPKGKIKTRDLSF